MSNLPPCTFQLSDQVVDEDLRELYDHLVARLRSESVPTVYGTLQDMLIERLVALYIMNRHKERHGTFAHVRNEKELGALFLAYVQELSRQARQIDPDALRSELTDQISSTIARALEGLHPDVANPLRERFAKAFEESGF